MQSIQNRKRRFIVPDMFYDLTQKNTAYTYLRQATFQI